MKKSNLGVFLRYASKNGMDLLEKEFKGGRSQGGDLNSLRWGGLNGILRDTSKPYDPDKKIIYYYRFEGENYDLTQLSEDSFPYSFDQHVKQELSREIDAYMYWLDNLVETESYKTVLGIISKHKAQINSLFRHVGDSDTPPCKALRQILAALERTEKYYAIDNHRSISKDTTSLLAEFVSNFAKKTKYSEEMISSYLEKWESKKELPNRRSLTKREMEKEFPGFIKMNDGTLSNWEKWWTKFKDRDNE